jgi:hypothetical protein
LFSLTFNLLVFVACQFAYFFTDLALYLRVFTLLFFPAHEITSAKPHFEHSQQVIEDNKKDVVAREQSHLP